MMEAYLKEEWNAVSIVYSTGADNTTLTATLNFKALGKKLGKDMKAVKEAIEGLSQSDLAAFEKNGKIQVLGHEITSDEMTLTRSVSGLDNPNFHSNSDAECMIIVDFTPDPELDQIYLCREIVNRVQKLRKEAKLHPDDPVDMWGSAKKGSKLQDALNKKGELIDKLLRRRLIAGSQREGHVALVVKEEEFEIDGEKLQVVLTSRAAFANPAELKKLSGGNADVEKVCRMYLGSFDLSKLEKASKSGDIKVVYDGKTFAMKNGTHFSLGPTEAKWLKA